MSKKDREAIKAKYLDVVDQLCTDVCSVCPTFRKVVKLALGKLPARKRG